MSLLERLMGRRAEEAARHADPAVPHPPAGGGGHTPYPTYDVMAPDKWAHDWDPKTRRVVLDRLHNVPERGFFSPREYATLAAVCARLLPQEDRPADLRIPIAPFIDRRLDQGSGNGYRYEDMPWDDTAYRRGLQGIDETSRALRGGRDFVALAPDEQDVVLGAVEDGEPPGETWRTLPARRFFRQLLQDVIQVYYAHPAAWNEIGFQGPASPRGHIRLALDKRDPWEAEETAPLPPEAPVTVTRGEGAAGQGGATH